MQFAPPPFIAPPSSWEDYREKSSLVFLNQNSGPSLESSGCQGLTPLSSAAFSLARRSPLAIYDALFPFLLSLEYIVADA